MAMTAKADEQTAAPTEAPEKDSPLLDLSDAAVKKFIKTAKARGFVTLDALNAVLPSEEVSPDQIEDTMSMLSDMGITVVESEEPDEAPAQDGEDAEEEEPTSRAVAAPSLPAVTQTRAEPTERTDDPVRMYLRDMGSVELLSREGEIAIAKRIEAGREAMIAGLCESPLTFQAVIIWRDELKDAKILLRDIIDLEATYEGPEAKAAPPPMPVAPPPVERAATSAGRRIGRRRRRARTAQPRPEGEMEDDDDFENALSLAAMEAELKPKVLETFDNIADTYKKLRKLQDKKVEMQVASEQFSRQQQKGYDKLRDEIIGYVKSLSLNNARIESLVEQLYSINKRLVALESRLMRLADSYGVPRQTVHRRVLRQRARPGLDRAHVERRAASGASSSSTSAARSTRSATRSARSPPRRASRSPSSAASSRPCRRASARRARPRRRWWRPTCASSSPSPRSTPTAACSSWT